MILVKFLDVHRDISVLSKTISLKKKTKIIKINKNSHFVNVANLVLQPILMDYKLTLLNTKIKLLYMVCYTQVFRN